MSTLAPWGRLPLPWRLQAFRLLESLAALRSRTASPIVASAAASVSERSLWVFVSTIGELNAIEPFLMRLLAALREPALTLISDRAHYESAYLAKYPQAAVVQLDGTSAAVQELVARRPPLMLLVAEIPCLLHDAPCRLSFAALRAVRQSGAPAVLVNGWLYGYRPPSRLDAIENRLFARDYVAGYDLMLVQTEGIRLRLIEAGAEEQRVVVTGNVKFDAMQQFDASPPPAPAPLREALRQRGGGPIIVAGSVTETSHQRALLHAFGQVLRERPDALLVLAPRHPENVERMAALHALMEELGLGYRLRSTHAPDKAVAGPVLIIDTMGELRSCYAEATLSYVGTDHNVLEPLAFGKPVFVAAGWDPTYPSYPVYRALLEAGVLHVVDAIDDLGTAWLERLAASEEGAADERARLEMVLARARGAVDRGFAALLACSALQPLALAAAPTTQRATEH